MRQQLQKRLTEEFTLRSTPLHTRLAYQRCIDRFERHFAASAATLGRAEVRQFLLHLVEHEKLSPITHNVYAAALYFLYANVLGRPRVVEKLPRRKGTQKLPVVLTPTEVARLLGVLPPIRRAVLMLAYGGGLGSVQSADFETARNRLGDSRLWGAVPQSPIGYLYLNPLFAGRSASAMAPFREPAFAPHSSTPDALLGPAAASA